jgi:hypothetical protein
MCVARRPTHIKAGPVDHLAEVVGRRGLVLRFFFAVGFPAGSVSSEDTDGVDGFLFFFMSLILRISLVLRLALAQDSATMTNGIAVSIGLWLARAPSVSRNPIHLADRNFGRRSHSLNFNSGVQPMY